MDTLQEFIKFQKQWEYVVAIGAVISFIGFWKLMSGALKAAGRDPDAEKTAH